MIAVSAVYVHRMTGSEDVVLGLPMMGRIGSASLNVPAMVMNLLPLRLTVSSSMSFSELIQQISREIRSIRRHHKYRHEELRRDLKLIGENHRLFGPQINLMPFDYVSTLPASGAQRIIFQPVLLMIYQSMYMTEQTAAGCELMLMRIPRYTVSLILSFISSVFCSCCKRLLPERTC